MRLKIDCSYDGTDFHGWARQPGLRTVQGELEAAIAKVLHLWQPAGQTTDYPSAFAKALASQSAPASSWPHLVVAGRTDTGVHARGQVCHLDLDQDLPGRAQGHLDPARFKPWDALTYRLRRILPDDLSVSAISPAPDGFDARFSASDRVYVYRVADDQTSYDPRLRSFVLNLRRPTDIQIMNSAAEEMVGLHDFGSFATPNPGGTTIREVKYAHWRRVGADSLSLSNYSPNSGNLMVETDRNAADCSPSSSGDSSRASSDHKSQIPTAHPDQSQSKTQAVGWRPGQDSAYQIDILESGLLEFTIIADAFAHNMVRSLVSASLQVGMGKKSLEWFLDKIHNPQREGASGPAPACGLTLEKVNYPPDNLLAARSQAIRAKRTLD